MEKSSLKEETRGLVRNIEAIFEVGLLAIAYYLVWRYSYSAGGLFPDYLGKGKYVLIGIYALLSLGFIHNFEGFKFGDMRRLNLAIGQWIALFITNFITYWQLCLIANQVLSPVPMLMLMAADVVAVMGFVFVYAAIYLRLYAPRRVVMVFGSQSALGLKFKMDTRKDKYRVEKLVPANVGFDAICKEIMAYDAVVINDIPAQLRNDVLKFCYENGKRTYVVPKVADLLVKGASEVSLFDTPLVLVKGTGLTLVQRFWKRAMDLVLGGLVMIVALPFMGIIAIAIKAEDRGPVFYKQKRATLNGREFDILKFRSMIVDAEKEGHSIPATGRDPRITKVGRIIRATRLDELPQIINILKGEMSVVGPRPERLEHVQKYSEELPEFAFRLKVKGGLTGYAQIYGKYNTGAYDKLRLDLMYIENYSLLLDIKLILMTLRVIFQKESTEGFDKNGQNEKEIEEIMMQLNIGQKLQEDPSERRNAE